MATASGSGFQWVRPTSAEKRGLPVLSVARRRGITRIYNFALRYSSGVIHICMERLRAELGNRAEVRLVYDGISDVVRSHVALLLDLRDVGGQVALVDFGVAAGIPY
eukprot:9743609-Prorocentrum_lima.AAC.1